MSTTALTEIETRLHRLERQKSRSPVSGRFAATNHANEIRTAHLIIVDNHGKVLRDEQGIDGEVYITRYATEQTIYR